MFNLYTLNFILLIRNVFRRNRMKSNWKFIKNIITRILILDFLSYSIKHIALFFKDFLFICCFL